jgi:hypothetical protein
MRFPLQENVSGAAAGHCIESLVQPDHAAPTGASCNKKPIILRMNLNRSTVSHDGETATRWI